MTFCNEFTLESLPAKEGEPLRSRLVHGGKRQPVVLEGVMLEAQSALEDGRYLLLLTDNCPYEEQVHIVLLDRFLRVRDRYSYGQPYTPGLVEAIECSGNSLQFRFAGLQFQVAVLDKPDSFQLGARLYRYLQVTKKPAVRRAPA